MQYKEEDKLSHQKLIKSLIRKENNEALISLLEDLDPVEITSSLIHLKLKHRLKVLSLLDVEKASEVISNLQEYEPVLLEMVRQMNPVEIGDILEEMDLDDAADVMSLLREEKATEVLEELPLDDREEITSLMQYHEETAGGIMNPEVVSIKKDQTVRNASNEIKSYIKSKEIDEFYVIFVVDEYGHLIGFISLTQLFLADDDSLITEIMNPDVIAVAVDLDQEKVAAIAKEYDLVTVPVIDKHLRLIGRITSDDVMDVLQEEYNEDIAQITGTGSEEVLEKSLIKASGDRLPWLLLGLAGGAVAAVVMSGYENALATLPSVAYFIPVVAALGGNIAIQSSSLVVRGLATGEIQTVDLVNRTWKEIRVGMLNGAICSIILFGLAWWITGEIIMAITTAGALMVVVFLAALVGTVVPILLKRAKMDPAVATGPFITTTNDIIGIIIYLAITIAVYQKYIL